jgi:hypothetical protein
MSTENVPNKARTMDRATAFLFAHWKKILCPLLLICAVGALCFAGSSWRKFQVRCAQNSFPSLSADSPSLTAFAEKYKSMAIGALAAFASGNFSSQSGDWEAAAASYGRCGPLKVARLDGAASIGEALCLLRAGNVQRAEKLLIDVAADGSQTNSVRAAAYYFRALTAWENGHRAMAGAALDAMGQLKECGPWIGRAALLSLAIR